MSNIRVAIVEDDSMARGILAGWVRSAEGFECLSEHGSAESALEQLPLGKPDVVLMDINLPGLNGVECVRRLKLVLPQTQFIMLTVYQDSDHIFDALTAGASGYLLKQTPCEELLTALQSIHAGGSPMTSNIARKVVQHFQAPLSQMADATRLSPREREVLEMLARGRLYKDIADKLGISRGTLNTHIRRIYEKLHVRSRAEAAAKYARLGA